MLRPGEIGLRFSSTTTSPYSNGMGWPALFLKYIVTSLKLEVFMGMKIRFGKSVVSIASLDYFFPETSGMSSSDIFRSILMNKLAEDFHFTDSKLQFKIKTEALISQK